MSEHRFFLPSFSHFLSLSPAAPATSPSPYRRADRRQVPGPLGLPLDLVRPALRPDLRAVVRQVALRRRLVPVGLGEEVALPVLGDVGADGGEGRGHDDAAGCFSCV